MRAVLADAPGPVFDLLFWTAAGPVVAALIGILTAWPTYVRPKALLLYSIEDSESLAYAVSSVPGLDIMHRGRKVKDPYRATIHLASSGRMDIEFLEDQSIVLTTGAKIVELLDYSFSDGSPALGIVQSNSKLKIGPGPGHIIRSRETLTLTLLFDGPPKYLKCEFPFKDLKSEAATPDESRWIRRLGVCAFINYIIVLFLYTDNSKSFVAARSLFLYFLYLELLVYIPAIFFVKYRYRLYRNGYAAAAGHPGKPAGRRAR